MKFCGKIRYSKMSDLFEYDVFVSYNREDKEGVDELVGRLKGDGLRVFVDEDEIRPGEPISLRLQEVLGKSRVLVPFMTKGYFESSWAQIEMHTFLFRDVGNESLRFVPLLAGDCEIPDMIGQYRYVDWRERSGDAYAELLAACRAKARPTHPPIRGRAASEREPFSLGHTDTIHSVAVTGDGKRAISGAGDNTVKIWDLQKHNCIATLEGHTDEVNSVAVTGDGKRAISGADDKTVKIWDLQKHNCIATLEGHTGLVWSVAVTSDGKRAISGAGDNTVKIWDLQKHNCIATLEGHTNEVNSVAVTGDGKRAISGASDNTVKIWDLQKHNCIATLEGHTGSVWSVAVTGDGKRAIFGASDKTVKIWDLQKHNCIATLEGHTDEVNSVAVTGDGKLAISGADDKTVKIWDLQKHNCIATLEGHTGPVLSVAVTGDGKRAISGASDKTVKIWDLQKHNCIATLEGHTGYVNSVAVTGDGKRAISGAGDKTVKIWNLQKHNCIATLEGHTGSVLSVAVTGDGKRAISGASDNTVKIWDLQKHNCIATLEGHTGYVNSVAVGGDGKLAISGASDKTVKIWDLQKHNCIATLEGHTDEVNSVAVTGDGKRAISGASDNTVKIWDLQKHNCIATLEGHTDFVRSVAVTGDGKRAISGAGDNTVKIWNLQKHNCIATLEGHTGPVLSVAVTGDGKRAISGADDNTVKIWDLQKHNCIATLEGHTGSVNSVAVTGDGEVFSGALNGVLRMWGSVAGMEVAEEAGEEASLYTNAKVLLCGDSGVGKTGLALRLAEGRFALTDSTDAAWATQVKLEDEGGPADRERDIWLWDFGGQVDYRLTHQLFMDRTSLAVLVFNPQHDNPFEGLGQWDRDLERAVRGAFNKLLVAGRCDRGGLTVSAESINQFARDRGFGGYLATSAKSGEGCEELKDAIVRGIDWESISLTSSPRLFKVIKDVIVEMKKESRYNESLVLLRMGELKQQLEMRLPGEDFTLEELRAVVGLLDAPGIVWPLEFGGFVLLQPERINAYAAAVVRKVRGHVDEMGCIEEEKVLGGDLDYQDMKRLGPEEESIVLRAMHQTFVDHGLCLREPSNDGMLLVFPSYFKRERPPLGDHPAIFVTYRFGGALDEIYATLVVRLHHSGPFEKDKLWRYAADFKTPEGRRLGFKMTRRPEGAGEITVYFEPEIAEETKVIFILYIHEHLRGKAVDLERVRHYVCPNPKCQEVVESVRAIKRALEDGRKELPCQFCGKSIPLWDLIEEKFASEEAKSQVRLMEEMSDAVIDNESRELILEGHARAVTGEAGQIYHGYTGSDWGIDGEIEFKDYRGRASGARLYLQLKSGDSHLRHRQRDDVDVFDITNPRWAEYWQQQAYPMMLVIRTSDGEIRWMEVSEYLRGETKRQGKPPRQIVFDGEPFTALNLLRLRERLLRSQ